MFLLEMTHLKESDNKVHKKIWESVEEMFDEDDDGNVPMGETRKKNICIFRA